MMEYYEIEQVMNKKTKAPRKPKKSFNNKYIVILLAIIFFVFIIILILSQGKNSNRKYHALEEDMITKAKEYVRMNDLKTSNEIYLDSNKLAIKLDEECDTISGVLYDGIDYKPYLKCSNYESKILDNNNQSITLKGNSVLILAKGIFFRDPGYISNNSIEVSGYVGTEEGVYNLYYYVKNDSNFVTRKVIVLDNDELKERYPKIALNGEETIYITQGQTYVDNGVVATDLVDGDISDKIVVDGIINTNMLGKQELFYSVTNSRGYQNGVERIVNVVDPSKEIYYDYKINPSNKVNSDVVITLSVSGKIYEYTTLPSGEKNNNNIIEYKVSQNGKYVFSIHDKTGNVTEKEIEVTNIDKEPPMATCDAIKYNTEMKIEVYSTSNKPISTYEYQINNISMKKTSLPSYTSNVTNVTLASVIIEDSVGNRNKINCDIVPYNNWIFDYSKMFVYLKNSSDNTIIKRYSLEDYLKGVLYLALSDIDFNDYTSEELSELFKTFFVLKKAELFSTSKYSIYSKQLIYKIEESSFCDIHVGCKSVQKNGKSFYISNGIDYEVSSDNGFAYEKLDDNIISIMNKAYDATKKEVVINKDFDDVLMKYTSSYVYINSNIKKAIIRDVLANKKYQEIISMELPNYKIYNITKYSSKYANAIKPTSKFYWPIGSVYADYRKLFSNTPESIEIVHDYGASMVDNKIYDGIAIKGNCGSTKVIASKAGRVVDIGSSSKYGDYVKVQHDNGISFLYGSLLKNSIAVKIGDTVKQGQLIGLVGSINNNCMLYVETYLNGTIVNPNEYISVNNLRPAVGDQIIYVEGGTVKRSVCLSLLASGFSVEATAGLMANIERESRFNLRDLSDGGTSIGLFQWHHGRFEAITKYCGDNLYTTNCQLEYLIHEFKTVSEYNKAYQKLLGDYSAYEMARDFCLIYERPAGGETSCNSRGEIAKNTYVPYILNNCN